MEQSNQLAKMSNSQTFTQQLEICLIKMQQGSSMEAKMDFMVLASELMPQGKPQFLSVIKYPKIQQLIQSKGKKIMLALAVTLVKDFCDSLNVVRNMNQSQMLEAANMLLDECDNFRLEDYVMMFQMAKRGELADIRDRIDLQLIADMLDTYWLKRKEAGEKQAIEEEKQLNFLGNPQHTNAPAMVWDDKKGYLAVQTTPQKLGSLMNAFTNTKHIAENIIGNREERDRMRQIAQADTERIKQQKKSHGYDQ
jgi:hypothetical protein